MSGGCHGQSALRRWGLGNGVGHVVHMVSSSSAAELEFAQIIIIIVVVTVMVVVIVCLLNHYKVSTRSFINRPSQSRRQEDRLQQVSVGLSLFSAAQASGPGSSAAGCP